ncbi:hypothetical protein P692DRAFT_20753118, partial [Suillus brevipes Sb2]
ICCILISTMGPQNQKYSRYIQGQTGGFHVVIRSASQRSPTRQVVCKDEYRSRNGPCNVLSVTRVHAIPEDLQANLAASQQAPRGSDVRNEQRGAAEIKRSGIDRIE